MILIFCCICSKIPSGLKNYIQNALSLIDVNNINTLQTIVGFEMLSIIEDEIANLDISRNVCHYYSYD